MATGKGKTPAKRKPLSTYDPKDPRYWAIGAWRLGLGTVRTTAAGHLHWRTWGDLATPATGAVSLYLLSAAGADPLGPLGPTLFDPDLLDVTDPWRLMVAATGATAGLMFQRSDAARARRERRAVQRAFGKLGVQEPPSALYPNGRPIQVGMPEPTRAGSRLTMAIPERLSEVELLQAAAILGPMLKGRVSMRPVPPPPSARRALTSKVSGTASRTVAVARRATTGQADAPVAKPKSPAEQLLSGSHVEISIRRREALTRSVPWLHLAEIRQPGFAGRSIGEPWHVGDDEDGKPVMQTIFQKNKLSGGEQGSGKSTGEHVDIAAVSLDPKARIFLIDPSDGVEFDFWRPVAEGGRDGCAYSPEEALGLLRCLHAQGKAALRQLNATADAREASGLPRTNVAPWETTTWIFIDELLALTKNPNKELREDSIFLLFDIIGRFRKVGFHLVCSTLKPTGDMLPTFIRDLIQLKQTFRCTTPEASTAVLGDKVWAALGYGGHKIEMGSPQGINYLLGPESYPVRLRSAFINPDRQPGQKLSERAEVLNAALRLRGLPEQTFVDVDIDPERAALLDPNRPVAQARVEREVITLAKPPSAIEGAAPVEPLPAPAPVAVAAVLDPRPAPADQAEPETMLDFVLRHAEVSLGMLQGAFGLSWDEGAQVISGLEEAGVLGPAEGGQMRKVLVEGVASPAPTTTPDEVEQARQGYDHRRKRRNRPRPSHRTDHRAPARAGATPRD